MNDEKENFESITGFSPVNELFTALSKAQSEFEPLNRNVMNPFFKSKYADLEACRDATVKALNKNGLIIIQPHFFKDGDHYVMTILGHSSGQFLRFSSKVVWGGSKIQDLGAAITYTRRYDYMAITGLAPEDDDGNSVDHAPEKNKKESYPEAKSKKEVVNAPSKPTKNDKIEAKKAMIKKLFESATWNGYDEEDVFLQFKKLGYSDKLEEISENLNKGDFETLHEYFEKPKSERGTIE